MQTFGSLIGWSCVILSSTIALAVVAFAVWALREWYDPKSPLSVRDEPDTKEKR